MYPLLEIPQAANAEAFYAERDSRSALEHSLATIAPIRTAIVVAPEARRATHGVELALFWTASIIRRMGRPFANIIIVSSDEFRKSQSSLYGAAGRSVEQVIYNELGCADP